MSKTKKLFKLIDKLEEELIYINGAFDHIKSHIVNKKDQPIMSASTLTVDLENGVDLINKIIEEKKTRGIYEIYRFRFCKTR